MWDYLTCLGSRKFPQKASFAHWLFDLLTPWDVLFGQFGLEYPAFEWTNLLTVPWCFAMILWFGWVHDWETMVCVVHGSLSLVGSKYFKQNTAKFVLFLLRRETDDNTNDKKQSRFWAAWCICSHHHVAARIINDSFQFLETQPFKWPPPKTKIITSPHFRTPLHSTLPETNIAPEK